MKSVKVHEAYLRLSCTRNTRYLSCTRFESKFSLLKISCTRCTRCTGCTRFIGSIRFDFYFIFIIIIIIYFIIFIIYLIYLFKNIYFQKSKNIYIPSTNVIPGKHESGAEPGHVFPHPPTVGDDQLFVENKKMNRNGCRMECQSGEECCVECRELELMRKHWGG